MHYYIGIDIGTTHTKVVLATESSKVMAERKLSYPSYQPKPGYHEQEPEAIFQAVWDLLKETIEGIADKENIRAISFSSAMHSLLAIDQQGKPLTPLITWADTRSELQARRLRSTAIGRQIHKITGTPIHPMSPLCKIAWIREEQPAIFEATHKFISIKEFVWFRFFGEYVSDHSIASASGLFNIATRQYAEEALSFAGIDASHLPDLVPVTHRQSALQPEYSIEGLSGQTTFIIGASDGCLANIGTGALLKGEAALTIGTSGAIRVLKGSPILDSKYRLFNYVVDEKLFLCGGAINNGGIALKWYLDNFYPPSSQPGHSINELINNTSTIAPGSEGLLFLPYLYGERAPVWDASAKAVFFGITAQHTRVHFLRSVLEAVAFSLLQIMEAMEESGEKIEVIYASGGFTESPVWLGIVADVLQKPLIISHTADASAMGAIYLGMMATKNINDWEEVKRFIPSGETIRPDQTASSSYRKRYAIYSTLYDRLKDAF